jgi:hypothetical protein
LMVICCIGSGMDWTAGLTCAMRNEGHILSIWYIKKKLWGFLYILVQTTCKKKLWEFLDYIRLHVHIILSYWVIHFWKCSFLF